MCVICAAAKKRHMKRAEVLEAIRHNSAGFFGFTVHDGVRRTVRTLDDKEFMKFFDEAVGDDDMWVMHARIPSRGEKSLDNVHGWEEDGIIFCHNMTISSIDGMMRDAKWENTDSEFFFRHIFMPFYRGCGEKAYEDGKFCQDLDNIVRYFCGSVNKFLFIMPDNRWVMYGDWITEQDRTGEDGKPAFFASNASYRTYVPAWSPSPASEWWKKQFRSDDCDYGLDDDDDYPSFASAAAGGSRGGGGSRADDDEFADLLVKEMGPARLCQMALRDVAAHGAIQYRTLAESLQGSEKDPDGVGFDDLDSDDLERSLGLALPCVFTDDTYGTAVQAIDELGSGDSGSMTPEELARLYAGELAGPLLKAGNRSLSGAGVVPYLPTAKHVEAGLARFRSDWTTFRCLAGLSMDFSASTPQGLVCMADRPAKDGSRWKITRVGPEDILVDTESSAETVFQGVGRLLKFIGDEARKAADGEEGGTP